MKRVSIKDIASKANVSTALVSYVLNNRNLDRINKDTAEKIRQIAKELHYRPNYIAQSLKLKKTFTVGLILSDIANPFSSAIAKVIESEANHQGYAVLIGSSDESNIKTEQLIDLFAQRQVDGLIIGAAEGTELLLQEQQDNQMPFVLIDRYFADYNFPFVAINNRDVAAECAEEMKKNGINAVNIISYASELQHLKDRVHGFAERFDEKHAPVFHIKERDVETEIRQILDKILETPDHPNAFFFTANKMAIEALKYFKENNIKIPEDIAVASFDSTDAFELFPTSITYIKQPIAEIGKKAVQLVIEQINNIANTEPHVILKAQLIPGDSTSKKHI